MVCEGDDGDWLALTQNPDCPCCPDKPSSVEKETKDWTAVPIAIIRFCFSVIAFEALLGAHAQHCRPDLQVEQTTPHASS